MHGVGLRVAQVLHDHPQHLHAGVRSGPGALLQPVEHLGRDQRRHAGQADLAGDHDRGGGAPPAGLVAPGVGPAVAGPPALVRFAVGDAPAVAVAGAGRDQAGAEPGQGAAGRVGGELVHRYPAQHLARPVRAAQPVRARRPRAARHHTARHARRRPGRADRRRPSELRVIRWRGQNLTGRVPAALGQEPWVDQHGQPDCLRVEDTEDSMSPNTCEALSPVGGAGDTAVARRATAAGAVAAPFTGPPRPAPADWAPRPPRRAAGTGRDGNTPAMR